MAKKDEHALYLINPDTTHVELVHADDLDAKKGSGWKLPTNAKPNGQPYNHEDDLEGQDAAAEGMKTAAEAKSKKDEQKQKDADAAAKAADKAREDEPEHADMTVRVVV